MNFFEHYSLLVAVLTPLSALGAMNAFLVLMGERDTLLLPLPASRPFQGIGEDSGTCEVTVINDVRQELPLEANIALTRDVEPANAHAHTVRIPDAA